MAEVGADPEVVKTLVLDWSTPEKRLAIAAEWIAKAGNWQANGYGMWGVFDREGRFGEARRLLGVCCADEPLAKGGEGPEIFYFFRRETWGQGIAGEATRAVVRYLLADLGLAAVEALIDPGLNPASIRIAERLGMTLVGRYSHADYEVEEAGDTIRFHLWLVANAPPEAARTTLEEAAIKIGQFVAAGLKSEAAASAALRNVAAGQGLAAALGDQACQGVIRAALRRGMAEPGLLHHRVTRAAFLHASSDWARPTRRTPSEVIGRRQRLAFLRRLGPAPDGAGVERQLVLTHEVAHVIAAPAQ